jgi:hypothetical protein
MTTKTWVSVLNDDAEKSRLHIAVATYTEDFLWRHSFLHSSLAIRNGVFLRFPPDIQYFLQSQLVVFEII